MKKDESKETFDSCRGYTITRENLEPEELQIYDRYLGKLDHPSDDHLRMLSTFAWLAVEFKKAAEDRKLALYIHRCMVYSRNLLGLWKQEPVDRFELGLDCAREWPAYFLYLDDAWAIGTDERD
jgi:hypothetical protein